MRILAAALALCLLSFALGIVGDLSLAAPRGPSAVVSIPADAVRAHPLPPLPRTDSADATSTPVRVHRARGHAFAPREKPHSARAKGVMKVDPDRAPKPVRKA